MQRKYYVCLVILFVFVLSVFLNMSVVFAGFKERYEGKVAPRNIQLNVQQPDQLHTLKAEEELSKVGREFDYARGQVIPAISYAVYSTEYQAEVEEDIATIKGTVNFEVFSKGTTKIPLVSSANVGLIEVSVNKGTSFIITEGNKYYLTLNKPGKYRLDLEYLIKVKREREHGPGQFRFEVLPAPISEFEFVIHEKDTEVFIEPSIKVETEEKVDKTVAWAIMPRTNNILVRWTKALPIEDIKPVKLEPKIYSTVYTFSSAGEGFMHCQSRINYSILQSEVSGLRLALPDDASILEISGRDLRDWKVSKKDNKQYVDIYFKFGLKGNYALDITYERAIGEGSVVAQIPQIKTLGIEREKGFIGIASATNVELRVDSAKHATIIDVKELPPIIWNRTANPILLAFKYLNDAYDIQIEVIRHEEVPVLVAAIDLANYVTLNTKDGKSLTKVLYHVRNNVKQFLRLEMPKGATLWSASVSNKPVKPAKDKKGHILIPLEKSQLKGETLTQFPVEVVYLEKGSNMGSSGCLKIDLPKADIPTSELYWSMYLPTDFLYYKFGGDVKKVEDMQPLLVSVGGVLRDKKDMYIRKEALSSQYRQQAYEQKTLDEVSQRGALPIKVTIPRRGKVLRFSKLLIAENESSLLSVRYITDIMSWLGRILLIIFAIVTVISVVNILKSRRHRAL